MDILNLFGLGVGFSVFVLFLVYLLLYIFPTLIISNSIKKINKPMYNIGIDVEYNDSFKLENGIVIYKDWYDKKNDLYDATYGFYIPIYSNDKNILAFMYVSKGK